MSAGIVKPHILYPKNSAQHAADLKMLLQMEKLQPAFLNPDTNMPKQITWMVLVMRDQATFKWTESYSGKFYYTYFYSLQWSNLFKLSRTAEWLLVKSSFKYFYSIHFKWVMLQF